MRPVEPPAVVLDYARYSSDTNFRNHRRPRFLLSGLVKCGSCGSTYTMMTQNHLGCSTRRNKGTCDNALYIREEKLIATPC